MIRSRRHVYLLIAFWIVVGAVYAWTAWQQKRNLNLSATAGGQMPYLAYAQGAAQEGVFAHFGDRNRMPLIPLLLSFFHDDDWEVFVNRACVFSIVTSVIVLIGIGALIYRHLAVLPATIVVLTATVCIFSYKASFVQAELAYYGLLFATWLMTCRLLARSNWAQAILCGLLLGLTYLTKASAVGALIAFLFAVFWRIIVEACRCVRASVGDNSGSGNVRRALRDACIVVVVFLLVASPYLAANKARFGRFSYNVNSTFFMWCDSWPQAAAFAETHDIASHYPQAPPDQIPGPANYWRTHSLSQMGQRLSYGFRTLAELATRGVYLKYLAACAAICLIMIIRHWRRFKSMVGAYHTAFVFTALFVVGYLTSYAWYTPVAYGDRFVLSLVLPVMFGFVWMSARLVRDGNLVPHSTPRRALHDGLFIILVAILLVDGAVAATGRAYRPTREFVQFYYNESREQQRLGNAAVAENGFRGVIRLDPKFSPAYHDLGMVCLESGRTNDAVEFLAQAANLAPAEADVQNSYGSALVQAGRGVEAFDSFREAVRLDPSLASAWYNLGGTCHTIGMKECAADALEHLRSVDVNLARKLESLIE